MTVSSPSSALKAGLVAGIAMWLPAIAYVLTRSAAHWASTLALGAACAAVAGLAFGLYLRAARAVTQASRPSRLRLAAMDAGPAEIALDPLVEAELELEERFAALDRRDRR